MKAIMTRFSGPTNARGSRIIASDSDGNRVIYDHSHALSHDGRHAAAAVALCEKMGWTGQLVSGGWKNGDEVFVFLGGDVIEVK